MSTPKIKKSERTLCLILSCAAKVFAEKGFEKTSIADVAAAAEISVPGVYRYFRGKRDLYFAALEYEVDRMNFAVTESLQTQTLPALTGGFWREYAALAVNYPLAASAIGSEDVDVLTLVCNMDSTEAVFDLIDNELTLAQSFGHLRQDIKIVDVMRPARGFMLKMLLPLVFNGKYNSPEWLAVSSLVSATIFQPMPDLSSPESIAALEADMTALAAKMAEQSPLQTSTCGLKTVPPIG